MKHRISVFLIAVSVLAHAVGTMAAELRVTRTAAGIPSVVFDDDFEDDAVGSDPAIGGGNVGSAWSITNSGVATVADNTTTSGFAAGDQFLQVANDGAGAGVALAEFGSNYTDGVVEAEFTALIPSNLGGGGLTHALLFTFQNANGGTGFGDGAESWTHLASGLWLQNEAGLDIGAAGIAPDEAAFAYFDGSWNIGTSGGSTLKFSTDTWVDVSLSLNLESGAMSVSVDGQTADVAANGFPNALGDAQGLIFRQNAGQGSGASGPFNAGYVGGVIPEPGSALLCAVGLLGLAVARRRKS